GVLRPERAAATVGDGNRGPPAIRVEAHALTVYARSGHGNRVPGMREAAGRPARRFCLRGDSRRLLGHPILQTLGSAEMCVVLGRDGDGGSRGRVASLTLGPTLQ